LGFFGCKLSFKKMSAEGRLCSMQENSHFWFPTMKVRQADGSLWSGKSRLAWFSCARSTNNSSSTPSPAPSSTARLGSPAATKRARIGGSSSEPGAGAAAAEQMSPVQGSSWTGTSTGRSTPVTATEGSSAQAAPDDQCAEKHATIVLDQLKTYSEFKLSPNPGKDVSRRSDHF
jgi:hypothetical protein